MASEAAPAAGADASGQDGGRAGRSARLALRLVRARDGDLTALDDVVRELNPLLWHVARSQGLGVEEAADVVQTIWLELLRRLHEIRSPEALTAWLVSATRREAWHTRTRLRRRVDLDINALASVPDQDKDVPEQLVVSERQQVLWRHFQRLSERCRALLRVVALVDRPDYSTVAEAMKMPRGSIGPTRGRCLAKLREMLLADPAWSRS